MEELENIKTITLRLPEEAHDLLSTLKRKEMYAEDTNLTWEDFFLRMCGIGLKKGVWSL